MGGGIRAEERVTLTNSTVSGNATTGPDSPGGGIWIDSSRLDDVIAVNSTISGNSTAGPNSPGGGISAGDVVLTNATVSGNTTTGSDSAGGGISAIRNATITSSTITQNVAAVGGHGIDLGDADGGTVQIENSIVSGNNPGDFQDVVFGANMTVVANYSFLGLFIPLNGTGNIYSQDPMLDSLSDNGGRTLTHAPLVGSRVIDAGDPSTVFDDDEYEQRGAPFVRVFDGEGGGARIDMGAFEVQILPASFFVVNNATDIVDYDYRNEQLTLREAINLANLNLGPDTITFANRLRGQTITLGGSELEITEALTIDDSAPAENVTIDADNASRIFNFTATTGDFALSGLILTGGNAAGDGGAIRSLTTGNLTLEQSTVSGNSSRDNGGGIYADSGTVILSNSTVSGNNASAGFASGGGIFTWTGDVDTQQ